MSLLVLGGVVASTRSPDNTKVPEQASAHHTEKRDLTLKRDLPLSLPNKVASDADTDTHANTNEHELHTTRITVQSGDSLSSIFSTLGVHSQLAELLQNPEAKEAFRRLRPGQHLDAQFLDTELTGLDYVISPQHTLHLRKHDDQWQAEQQQLPTDTYLAVASGSIDDSLFLSAQRAGLNDNLIMELAAIFGWDIDFALDIRRGDRFSLVYEEHYQDGLKIGNGNILAAEFSNQGKTYRAIRFENDQGNAHYYSPEGNSMRKSFLRTPVDFSRISSRFNPNRLHPIFKTKRPHRGVDYAAATGTPVKSSGDGKIIYRGTKGGYGRVVIVQHGERYTTLYAHLNSFRKGQRVGTRVKQGQVIGFVGSTGWATGPHLHYEFRVNGVHRNPLTVSLPAAKPLLEQYRVDFERQAAPMMAKLDLMGRQYLASLSTTP